jgi:meromycolic acid (3R)-3-hydroxyacyl-[acyl-carrier protein] dehydratase HadC
MALKTDIRGMSRRYSDHWIAGREKIREDAAAVKADDPASFAEAAAAQLATPP